MDNNIEERLLSEFRAASGGAQTSGASGDRAGVDEAHAAEFDPSQQSGAGQSYHGTSGSTTSATSESSGGALESVASSIFGGALGLVPLVGSLFGLFGGDSQSKPVLQKYEMPSPIDFEAAVTSNGLTNADYGQMGLPRIADAVTLQGASQSPAPQTSGAVAGGSNPAGVTSAVNGAASSSSTPQISVNVQAMDAQSFMSYSGEIAKAVRDAMLNLSSLNDVVSDL